MTPSERLRELGITLPAPARPAGAYIPAVRIGKLVWTAGQLPVIDGRLTCEGKAPADVSLERARAAARLAAVNALAAAAAETDGVDGLSRIVRVNVFVNSSPGFADQAKVANGASDLFAEVFGEAGRHTRCAVGAAELPLNASVEVDILAEAV